MTRAGRPDRFAGLPPYDELPTLENTDLRHAWGLFGDQDELGTLNLLQDATVAQALLQAETGERVGLTLDSTAIDPPLYGRQPLEHSIEAISRNVWDDRLDVFYPQAASQWDGLRHIRCREFGFYGGVTQDPPEIPDGRLGIHHWARRGIIGRGVLLDIARHLENQPGKGGYDALSESAVEPAVLAEVAEEQGVTLRDGDVLCLRFGWTASYRALDAASRHAYAHNEGGVRFAGLAADERSARTLWDLHPAAVTTDNPALEVAPGDPRTGSLHRRLIPTLGMVIGELFDFEELAKRSAEDKRWTFVFVAVPLNIYGGLGSPANAVAIR
jgi:kynurenine formamidase